MNILIKQITVIITVIAMLAISVKAEIPKHISYAIDYELGIAHLCDGTDEAYEVHGCKYDYTEFLNQ